jgi:hypothetical protein
MNEIARRGSMARWIVEGARSAGSDQAGPESVSEPFMTRDGAKSFAKLLREKGYVVVVLAVSDKEKLEEISGAAVVEWLNSAAD